MENDLMFKMFKNRSILKHYRDQNTFIKTNKISYKTTNDDMIKTNKHVKHHYEFFCSEYKGFAQQFNINGG